MLRIIKQTSFNPDVFAGYCVATFLLMLFDYCFQEILAFENGSNPFNYSIFLLLVCGILQYLRKFNLNLLKGMLLSFLGGIVIYLLIGDTMSPGVFLSRLLGFLHANYRLLFITVLFPLLAVAVVYKKFTQYLSFSENPKSNIINWHIRLASSLIAISVGISVTFLVYFSQDFLRKEKERQKFRQVLSKEMFRIQKYASAGYLFNIKLNGEILSVPTLKIGPIALEDVVKSGLFDSNDASSLSDLLALCQRYDQHIEVCYLVLVQTGAMMNKDNVSNFLKFFIKQTELSRGEIVNGITLVRKKMLLD